MHHEHVVLVHMLIYDKNKGAKLGFIQYIVLLYVSGGFP